MIQSKMIEKEEDLHCSLKHKLPVLMVVCDCKLKRNERLLCSECMENFESKVQIMSFKKVLENIQQNQNQKKENVENVIMNNIKLIEEFQKSLFLLKSHVIQVLDQLIGNVEEWIKHIVIIGQQNVTYSLFNELDNLINKNRLEEFSQKSLIDQINLIQLSWNQKIEKNLNLFKSFQESQKCDEILQKLRNVNQTNENKKEQELIQSKNEMIQVEYEQKQLEQQSMYKQVQFNFIDDSNKQRGFCYAIVFNNDDSIMVSCEQKQIKIWKFEQGTFQLTNSYNEHNNDITCLVYSKKTNNFISGSSDHQIICWQQINQNEWKCSLPFKQHTYSVNFLLLNKQEDQLLSGDDRKIIVWKVEFIKNDLTFLYFLDNHSNLVLSLSFNQSETVLASCGYSEFIIWEKGISGKWEFKYILEQIKCLYLLTNIQLQPKCMFTNLQKFHFSISLSIINMFYHMDIKSVSLMINNFFGQLMEGILMIFWYLNYRMKFLYRTQIKQFLQLKMMNVKILFYFQQYIIKIEM